MSHRLLLYGASNLWLSRRAALTELRRRFPGHLEIGLAHGPGRSYGLRAGNPLFRYEPLRDVEFEFRGEVSGHRLALITDVGNDVAYQQKPETVVTWVSELALRLSQRGYDIIIGGLPVQSLSRLNPRLFQTFSKLYYSDDSVTQEQVNRSLFQIEDGLIQLCRAQGYHHLPLDPNWYSYDNFHLKRRACSAYWQSLLSGYPVREPYSSALSLQVRRPLFPRSYSFLGREQRGREFYPNLVPKSFTSVR